MLHVSTRGEYGVRLMVDLARHYGQGLRSLTDISRDEGLPVPYLEQLMKKLREAELVNSARGAHGGYELIRPPNELRMSDILRALEGPLGLYSCVGDEGVTSACDWDRLNSCSTRVLWTRVRNAVIQTLDAMTLADLLPVAVAPVATT